MHKAKIAILNRQPCRTEGGRGILPIMCPLICTVEGHLGTYAVCDGRNTHLGHKL